MAHPDCKFEDKVIEMWADIKWLVKETKRINGGFREHLRESDNFRNQVTHNTAWRWAYKCGFIIVFVTLAYMLFGG